MSVVVLVTFEPNAVPPTGRGNRLHLPVASQQTFVNHWLPLAQALGLEFVPLFETGMVVGGEDLPHIIGELESLAAHAPAALPSSVAERIRMLLEHFCALDPATIREIFIG